MYENSKTIKILLVNNRLVRFTRALVPFPPPTLTPEREPVY